MAVGLLASVVFAFVPAFFFAWFINWLDRYEKEPKLLLVATFLWGAIVAVIGAIIVSLIMDVGFTMVLGDEGLADLAGGSITAPLVEESWKGLAVLIVFLLFRKEFDSILDGIVYGAIVGLGFAATENVLYFFGQFSEAGWGGFFTNFFLRIGIFAWGHPSYTALTGIGFAVSRTSRNTLVKFIAPFVGLGMAMFAHSFHNTAVTFVEGLGGLALTILVEWAGLFVMLCFTIWMILREQGLLKKHLREEVANGLLSPAQYHTANSFFQFGARMAALSSGTLGSTARFYQVCGELAHKKEQLEKFGDEKGNMRIIQNLRAEMQRLAPQAKT
ncbi:MAG: PrsW family intramembrane metalloprotease [Anaerolineales bacterium]|nr:PrsW family intramembrane metalloprotease [Anaerolineales bacterium]